MPSTSRTLGFRSGEIHLDFPTPDLRRTGPGLVSVTHYDRGRDHRGHTKH